MIPLTRPAIEESEIQAASAVLRSGQLVQGPVVAEFEQQIAVACNRLHGIAVSSGTSALECALRALEIGPGDEVLVAALTWPSPAHAVRMVGATPVLVDVDPDEWNTTAEALHAARTKHTRAAIVIDQFGNPCRRTAIEDRLADLWIVEDAACALGSRFDTTPCGSLGTISCLSFHPRKVLTTGEGGMCLTDDPSLAERLKMLRDHGRSAQGAFLMSAGNHRLTDFAAALGVAQLEKLERMVRQRRAWLARYANQLPQLKFQRVPEGALHNGQTAGALLPSPCGSAGRDAFVKALASRGVQAASLSYALERLASLKDAYRASALNAAADIADRGVALPLFPSMTQEEHDRVVEAAGSALKETLG